MRWPCSLKSTSAPPCLAASWARTRSGDRTVPQHWHVALARVTVPGGTSLSIFGSKISNSIFGTSTLPSPLVGEREDEGELLTTQYRNDSFPFAFLHSQNDRTNGITAPQVGA